MAAFEEGRFDPFSFDSMSVEERLELYRRSGTAMFNDNAQQFAMRNFSDETRPFVAAIAFSDEFKLPSILTASGDVIQVIYDPKTLRIAKFRAMPKAKNAGQVVQLIMSMLLEESGGDLSSIDPDTIGFGETERFERTYKGEWENAYRRFLATKSLTGNPFTGQQKSTGQLASNLREMAPRADAPQRASVQGFNAA